MTEAERAILVDYVDLFATPAGKRVLEDMKRRSAIYGSKVKKGLPIDTSRLIWWEAQRAFVLEIEARSRYDFSKEKKEEKESNA